MAEPELRISTDPADVDIDLVHGFLSRDSYWCPGVPREVVARAIAHSLCFTLRLGDHQIGFARAVSDRATFAYLADVFVLPAYRGRGYGKRLIAAVLAHPDLQQLRRILLATRDAHELYAGFGFEALNAPERFMQIYDPEAYRR